jgi:hypothetical protein
LQHWHGKFPDDCPNLEKNYYFEDQRNNDLGLIIGEDMEPTGNINQAIVDFLTPIMGNANTLKAFSPILRIKIYNKAYSCSINLNCLNLINSFGAELDINVFPTIDDYENASPTQLTF